MVSLSENNAGVIPKKNDKNNKYLIHSPFLNNFKKQITSGNNIFIANPDIH
jgi:hypothetical protein